MNCYYKKEFVKYDNSLPFKIYLCKIDYVTFHWHKELELIYVIKGELRLEKGSSSQIISENELVVINKNEVHQFSDNNGENVCIVIQIDLEFFKPIWPELLNLQFQGNETLNHKGNYGELKRTIFNMLDVIKKEKFGYVIEIQGLICQIISNLVDSFDYSIEVWEEDTKENYARLDRIIKFIEGNYMSKITLKEIAKTEFLSEYYFSHFFKKTMGVSFQTYLKQVRLQKAHFMLCSTNNKIMDIAMTNGFSNVQIFNNAFKAKYGDSPSRYKKNMLHKVYLSTKGQTDSSFDTVEIEDIIDTLRTLLD